jgi:hypothetical protein
MKIREADIMDWEDACSVRRVISLLLTGQCQLPSEIARACLTFSECLWNPVMCRSNYVCAQILAVGVDEVSGNCWDKGTCLVTSLEQNDQPLQTSCSPKGLDQRDVTANTNYRTWSLYLSCFPPGLWCLENICGRMLNIFMNYFPLYEYSLMIMLREV